jgi:peptide/nickel transport system ATP-binding protein
MAIPGAPPNLKFRPEGCRFAERCRYADEDCHKVTVDEQAAGPGRSYRCRHKLEELYKIYENNLPTLLDDSNEGAINGKK